MTSSSLAAINHRLKRWPGLLLLGVAAAVLLAIGAAGDGGPSDPSERADAIAQQLACPVCDGESVYESRVRAAVSIRNEITALVNEGRLSDDEIITRFETAYGDDILLLPRSEGVDVLAWALPAAAAVCAGAGLVVAFRRWRLAAGDDEPTESDRMLVSAALAEGDGDDG
jgi:cytochrome c-type biogenesis protein CcmH